MQAKVLLTIFIAIVIVGLTPSTQAQQGDAPLAGSVIYFAEENGEATRFDRSEQGISRYAGIVSQLGATMQTLEWNSGIPAEADLLIIPGPANDLSSDQVARLWMYINNGGRVLIAADAIEFRRGDIFRATRSLRSDQGLFELFWPDFGIRPDENVIVSETDDPALAVPLTAEEPPENPALLNIEFTTNSINPDAELMAGIEGPLYLAGARSVSLDATTPSLLTVPLFFAESGVYGEADFNTYLNEGVASFNPQENDVDGANLPLGAAMVDSATNARIVLLGDVDLITNGGGFQSSPSYSSAFVYPSNVQLATQITTWLLEAEAPALNFPEAEPTPTETAAPEATEESTSD